jgi:hypothetical protein
MTDKERQAMLDEMKSDKDGKGEKKFWNPPKDKEGTFPIRFLPPLTKKAEKKFYMQHKVHWIDGEPFECLDQTLVMADGNVHEADKCPVCAFVKKLYKTAEKNSDEWKLAGELNVKVRTVARIVIRGKEDETVPEFYEFGPTIFDMLFHIMTETDFGIIVDPKNGRDFNLTRVGTGRQSKYNTSMPSLKETQIFDDVEKLKKLFENAMTLDYNSLIKFTSSDEMEKSLHGYLGGGSSDKVESEPIKKEANKKAAAKSEPAESNSKDDEIDDILNEFTK